MSTIEFTTKGLVRHGENGARVPLTRPEVTDGALVSEMKHRDAFVGTAIALLGHRDVGPVAVETVAVTPELPVSDAQVIQLPTAASAPQPTAPQPKPVLAARLTPRGLVAQARTQLKEAKRELAAARKTTAALAAEVAELERLLKAAKPVRRPRGSS